MKNIFISILMILVFSCGGGGGGSSSTPTNCEQCVYNSITEFIEGGSCDASDLNASGCINLIQLIQISSENIDLFVVDGGLDITIPPNFGEFSVIYYNTNFNITGFQFHIENMENISSYNTYGFTIATSEATSFDGSIVVGYSLTGETIPAGCGMLMYLEHNAQANFQISNITFTDDTVNEDYSPNIIDVCPL